MAGHSAWKNIKHKKAKMDARRGKVWSKCARAIIVAARNGGGSPDSNLSLRYAILEARAANMPRDTIENAIKKGTGELGAENYERTIYEGYGPGGVAILIDILTNNRNRTASDIRMIFSKGGGNLGASGSVSYLFQNKGQLFVPKAHDGKPVDEDRLMSIALDAGAEDVVDQDEAWMVLTETPKFLTVRETLEKAGVAIDSAELTMIPTTTTDAGGDDAERLVKLIDTLEDNEDVQKVYANFEMSAAQLEALEK